MTDMEIKVFLEEADVKKDFIPDHTENKLKCPFCSSEMAGTIGHPICHYNPDCPIHDETVPVEVLELLDRTKKQLELALSGLQKIADAPIGYCLYAEETLEQINNIDKGE